MATLPIGPHRIEAMLQYLLDIAKQMLEKNGAFFPFGAIIDSSGNRIPVTAQLDKPDPKTHEAFSVIAHSMRAQYAKGEIVAGAIVAQASIPPELKPTYPDGVRIVVESASISRLIFLPIQRVSSDKEAVIPGPQEFRYGELLGVDVHPTLFAAGPS